jgi:hypothetical protein
MHANFNHLAKDANLAVNVPDADKHMPASTISTFRISKLRHAGFHIWRIRLSLTPKLISPLRPIYGVDACDVERDVSQVRTQSVLVEK